MPIMQLDNLLTIQRHCMDSISIKALKLRSLAHLAGQAANDDTQTQMSSTKPAANAVAAAAGVHAAQTLTHEAKPSGRQQKSLDSVLR